MGRSQHHCWRDDDARAEAAARSAVEPATAAFAHHQIGLPANCQIFDLSNACLGFLNALTVAGAMIDSGQETIVGVNKYKLEKEAPMEILEVDNSAVRLAQIKQLQELKAARDNGARPLHVASDQNQLAAAELLLDAGAAVNALDNAGRSPLARAELPAMRALLAARGGV